MRTDTVTVEFNLADVSRIDIVHRLAEAGFPVLDATDGDADSDSGSSRGLARIGVLAVIIASVALIGYAGYVVYPRFDLPSVEGAAVFGLAAAAGVAAFFSPCSFPLLLAILGRHASARARDIEPVASRPALLGAVLALGAGGFLLIAGLLIAAGGGALFAQVTFDSVAGIAVRAVVGVLLVGLGLVQAEVIGVSFRRAEGVARPLMRRQARLRRDHPLAGHALFGFGYVLAGFGWTGPILAGLASYAFAIGGFAIAVTAFTVAAATITGCVFAATFAVAHTEQATLARIEAQAPAVKRWTGWILVGIGAWFLVLAVFADAFTAVFPV